MNRRRFVRYAALILGIVTIVPLVIGWFVARFVMYPRRKTEDHTLDDFSLASDNIVFRSRDGTQLAGSYIAPPARTPLPAPGVVLSHGWSRSRAELFPHADMLHRAGYAVLAFDYRYRGESSGRAITMGIHERGDLSGAIDALSERPEVDAGRIGVFGMSLGAVIAIEVAAQDARVRAVATEAPFGSHEVIMTRSIRHYLRLPPFPFAHIAKWLIERRAGGRIDDIRPASSVQAISPRPVYIMADELDAVVGAEEAGRVFEAACEPKRYWFIEGADHSRGWQAQPAEYERRLAGFFNDALRSREASLASAGQAVS